MAILHETHVLLRFLCVCSNKYVSRIGVALDCLGSMGLSVFVDLFGVRLSGFHVCLALDLYDFIVRPTVGRAKLC